MSSRNVVSQFASRWVVVGLLAIFAGRQAMADVADPKGAMAAIGTALAEGDSAAIADLVTGDADSKAWLVALTAQTGAFRSLEAALSKKFGPAWRDAPAGAEIHESLQHFRDDDLLTDWRRAKLGTPDRDGVPVVLDEGLPNDRQGSLLKAAGGWKLDAGSLAEYANPKNTPVYRATAEAAVTLARQIADGKFASLEVAAKAVEEKLEAAETSAGPATRPAVPAAPKPPTSINGGRETR